MFLQFIISPIQDERVCGIGAYAQTQSQSRFLSIQTKVPAISGVYTVEVRDANTDVRVSDPAVLKVLCCGVPTVTLTGLAVLLGLIMTHGVARTRKK